MALALLAPLNRLQAHPSTMPLITKKLVSGVEKKKLTNLPHKTTLTKLT